MISDPHAAGDSAFIDTTGFRVSSSFIETPVTSASLLVTAQRTVSVEGGDAHADK